MRRPSICSSHDPCRRPPGRRAGALPGLSAALATALVLALALGALARPASAGQGIWTPIGPYGGTVTALAFAPASGPIYAGTASSGLFRSTDGGATWQPVPKGPGGGQVMALSLAASQPSTLHVVVNGSSWRSDDAGVSWTATAFPANFSSVVVAPSDALTVYGTDGFSVFASGDGGASVHQAASVSSLLVLISGLAVSPLSSAEVYAVTNQGLFKTTDGGTTWGQLPLGGIAVSLAVDPFDPATLYAGTGDGAVFSSHDRGATWARTATGLGAGSVDAIAPDPATRGTLYAALNGSSGGGGIWKSVNFGATWRQSTTTTDRVDALAADPAHAGKVFAGLEPSGISQSEDGGATWAPSNQGLSGTVVLAAAADPFTPGTLYAAVYSHNRHNFPVTGIDDQVLPLGLLRSRDGGTTWARADTGLDTTFIVQLLADPKTPGRLYAVSNTSTGRIFSTADGADSWHALVGDPGLQEVTDMALDPKHPGFLFLVGGSLVGNGGFFQAERSTDGGATWTVLHLPVANAGLVTVAVDPFVPARVYFGGTVLLKSYRRGDGLTRIGSGLPKAVIEKLLPDLLVPSRIYAITGSGAPAFACFRSLDGGATWLRSSSGLPPQQVPLFDMTADAATATLFISSAQGVHLSRSGGAHWRPASNGLLGAAGGLLVADPLHPGTAFTASELGGLWTYTLQ